MNFKVKVEDVIRLLQEVDAEIKFLRGSVNKPNSNVLSMLTMDDLSKMFDLKEEEEFSVVFNRLLRKRNMGTSDIYNLTGDHPAVYNKIASGQTKKPSSDTLLKMAVIMVCDTEEVDLLFKAAKSSITTKRERIVCAFLKLDLHRTEKIHYIMENIDYVLDEIGEPTLFS